jgi:hypothetical protein
VLSGVVRDVTSGRPVPGARVRVGWQKVDRVRPVVQARDHWIEVSANAEGRYTACGVPIDEEIRVIASFLDRKSDEAETSFSKESHQVLDLGIELRAGLLAGRGEVTVRSTEYGAQGIQGVLVERGSSDRIRPRW